MLRRKRQRKYLVKRCLELRDQLHTFAASGSQEALHKLRVEIKKLKAFSELTKLYKGEKEATIKKNIKKIFHRAGIIREAGINLQMIRQFDICQPLFSIKATNIIQQESAKFRLHETRYDHDIRNTVISLLQSLHPVHSRDIKQWFSGQLKKIAIVVTAASSDQLHEARKKIKNLIYVHGILHKPLAAELKLKIDYLDQMQDAIGKWHDAAVAVDLLEAHGSGKAKASKLRREQDKAREAIHAIGDGFWEKVVKQD
ncbi:CHAD domain-containing protein [Chitinophaga filiformis]|uniref:CHAD domain-containing protein n=1 Tax=Chitinophaga filiformis TaxID=104663 RepID=UPI001F43CDD2|nr:CHAD domain-containing protein [Chitinophaga filiformis]MCF6402484.1 CHAD domain-containing protein [Chitinophaga filiformis]